MGCGVAKPFRCESSKRGLAGADSAGGEVLFPATARDRFLFLADAERTELLRDAGE
jgi:hypothetical protein